MINVPDPFTLSVVYMTTDAMPSPTRTPREFVLCPLVRTGRAFR